MSRRACLLAILPLLALGCGGTSEVDRVVLVTLDTTRADRLGCYGYEAAETPTLDALAASGVLFEQAVSAVPVTLPSHSTMFTGQYPHDLGVRYNLFPPLGDSAVTLAETLSAGGFTTAAFPASHIIAAEYGLAQGFKTWIEPPTPQDLDEMQPLRGTSRPAAEGVDLAIDWLEADTSEKSFVWLHMYDAHYSYLPPFPYSSRYRDRPYDGELAYVDSQLGRLLDYLRGDARWGSTLFIVAGDHGEGLYDHKERWHTMLAYETTQRVPLIMHAPGATVGRIAEPVSLVDLTPTILDMVGLTPTTPMRGISLRPALDGVAPPRRDLYFEAITGSLLYGWQEVRGVRSGRWKLIDGSEPELFDLQNDPGELNNLAPLDAGRVADLTAALRELSTSLNADSASAEPSRAPQMDPETLAMLEGLGYVGGAMGGSAVGGGPLSRTLVDLEPELLSAQTAVANANWELVEDLSVYTLGRDPSNRWALAIMVDVMIAREDFAAALEHARAFRGVYPDLEQSFVLLAKTHMARKRPAEAYAVLREGIESDGVPDSEPLQYLAIVAAFDAERADVCSNDLARSLAHFPYSGRLMMMRARCEARDGDAARSLETLRAAAKLGFKWFEQLKEAPDFAPIVALPGFSELLEAAETEAG